MTQDRISLNTPETWTGGDWALDTVDEIVLYGATVHVEMLNDDAAYFHLRTDDGEVRGHLTAVLLSRRDRRQARRARRERLSDLIRDTLTGRTRYLGPRWRIPATIWDTWRNETPRAALLITVEDDELGIGEER